MALYDSLGIVGFVLYLLSYALLQARRISGGSVSYIIMNLATAVLVLLSLTNHFNLASALIQISWIIISLFGLFYVWRQRNRERVIWRFAKNTRTTARDNGRKKIPVAAWSTCIAGLALMIGLAGLYTGIGFLTTGRLAGANTTTVVSQLATDQDQIADDEKRNPPGSTDNNRIEKSFIPPLPLLAEKESQIPGSGRSTEVNLWTYYLQALRLEPDNARARVGQRRLFAVYVELAKQASHHGNSTLSAEFSQMARQILFGQAR